VLGAAGAAEVVEQKDLQGRSLAVRIQSLLNAPDRLAAMAAAARKLARPDAVRVIADKAMELIQRNS
jgi:UDP-N-acetylglucosamine--N-acetylmuramyl-(pentapeptide) pyrophosphoryl-undecaprenol N-acetylglucosamine transferase